MSKCTCHEHRLSPVARSELRARAGEVITHTGMTASEDDPYFVIGLAMRNPV